jgi:hypothetical protein
MSLQEMLEKCKSDQVFAVTLIILVGIGSFGLGRLSKIEQYKPQIAIEGSEMPAPELTSKTANSNDPAMLLDSNQPGEVVASKSGSKYHFPWCAGAKSIADKNKVWFNSAAAAREAGYTPASNCKGLQ